VAEKATTTVITGNLVDFGKIFSGLDSVGLLIRVSNVPADFSPTVTVKTAGGQDKVLAKASIPGAPLTLAYSGLDLFAAAPFQTLEFSQPLPAGAVVEVFDANGQSAFLTGAQAAFVGFRKRFDINGDQRVTTSDLSLVLAWIQTSRSTDASVIRARGLEIYPAQAGAVATLPAIVGEDLNDSGAVDTLDVVLSMAWIQCGRVTDATLVFNRAKEISTAVTAAPTKFPGETVPGVLTSLIEILLPGGVKMPFATLPAGEYLRNRNYMYEAPESYLVTISKSLVMGMTEVTRAQYQAVLGADPSYFRTSLALPVDSITWEKAVDFCNALSDQQGLSRCYTRVGTDTICNTATNGYRLPTEAEWEYAYRAGTNTDNYWGSPAPGQSSTPDSTLYCWYNGNAGGTTHEVGTKLPNAWGLYDMAGNVLELVNDWGDGKYPAGAQTDPTGPATGTFVMTRGGDYGSYDWACTGGIRTGNGLNNPYNNRTGNYYLMGFRVVRNRF
jgi:formylglycine-generating enzyme required for sulfatase activity